MRAALRNLVVTKPLRIPPRPWAAFGMRRVVRDYAGPACRVARTSDGVEVDLYFASGDHGAPVDLTPMGAGTGRFVGLYDQSGNGRAMAKITDAKRPLFDAANFSFAGAPMVEFDGNQNLLNSTKSLALPAGNIDRGAITVLSVMDICASAQKGLMWEMSGTARVFGFTPRQAATTTDPNQVEAGGSGGSDRANVLIRAQPMVVSIRNGADSNKQIYISNATATIAANAATAMTGGTIGMNAQGDASRVPRGGMLAWIIYDRDLGSDFVRASRALEALFKLDSGYADRLVIDGDSHADAYRTTRTWPRQFDRYLRAQGVAVPEIYNLGRSAFELENLVTMLNNIVIPHYDPTKRRNILALDAACNDFLTGDSSTNVINYFTTYMTAVRAAGFKTIASTVRPRWASNAWTGSQLTHVTAYNTWIRANWATYADAFADVAANPYTVATAAANDADWWDYLHPGPLTLYDEMINCWAPAIAALRA